MVFQNNVLSGAAGSGTTTYAIDQSIRFDDAAEHYMYSPAPSSSKSFTTTATISMWIKLGNIGQHYFAGAFYGSNARYDFFQINANNKLQASGRSGGASTATGSGVTKWITTQVFRDPSAWYHLIFVYDTTNAVQSERFRLYVNGERVTEFDTAPSYGASELVYWFGKSSYTTLGAYYNQTGFADYFYWDGYMAEMHGVDGTALDQDSFGEFNSSGIWTPKEYTGSHGTDGFYIKGADASDLGTNSAANGNDFTLNGLSSHDKMLDSPTNNFPTFNPIYADVSGINSITLANGNLQGTGTSGQFDHKTATFNLPQSGKWYFEYYLGGLYTGFGICIVGQEGSITGGYGFGALSTSQGFGFQNSIIYNGNSVTTNFGTGNLSAGTILNCAFDVDNDKVFLGLNNTYYAADAGSDGNPSTGANPTVTTSFSLSTNDIILGFYLSSSSSSAYLNFGQEGTFAGNKTAGGNSDASGIGNFLYSVPTGFKALCTKNLGS